MSLVARAFVKSAVGAARFRLTGRRAPLSVTLAITRRCDTMCRYCDAPASTTELAANEWLEVIDELAALGCNRVIFGGAEPLLRPELPAFLDRCRDHGMWTVVETNGHAIPQRVQDLLSACRLMISIDGCESVHDAQREPGSFAKATAGLREARKNGIEVGIITLLTRLNADRWQETLDLAEQFGCSASFQPLWPTGPIASRGARRLAADDATLHRSMLGILEAKQAGRPVAMSEKTLRHLLNWDNHSVPTRAEPVDDLVCMAGQVSCAVDANGDIAHCGPRLGSERPDAPGRANVRDGGFLQAFSRLADNSCHACTSTACTEASFLYNLNSPVVIEFARAGTRTLLRGAA